ncbi:MAG: right-handed parallel beta-helix repeat-containing protein, partial [Thermoprotei archaeon]
MRRIVSGIMLTLLLIGMLMSAFNIKQVKAESRTIVVPNDYPSIQAAINAASTGDTIFVKSGTYHENVMVDKTLKLIGENQDSIIQGSITFKADNILFDGFTITNQDRALLLTKVNFCRVSNCNISNNNVGIFIYHEPSMSNYVYARNSIFGNIIMNNNVGVLSYSSMDIPPQSVCGDYFSNNIFIGNNYGIIISNNINIVQPNKEYGGNVIRSNTFLQNFHCLYFNYTLNTLTMSNGDSVTFGKNIIRENNFTKNDTFLEVYCESINLLTLTGDIRLVFGNNTIFNNYFKENRNLRNGMIKYIITLNADTWPEGKFIATALDQWDGGYPVGGNFWANYYYEDVYSGPLQNANGSDGIFDKPYWVNLLNKDRYPLAAPINVFYAGMFNEVEYYVDVISISEISNFYFNPNEGPFLKFSVTSNYETKGFCRITIPRNLLWVEDGWIITVDGQQVKNFTILEDYEATYLYFTYSCSTKQVIIQGTNVILEFPSTLILALFIITTLIA